MFGKHLSKWITVIKNYLCQLVPLFSLLTIVFPDDNTAFLSDLIYSNPYKGLIPPYID
jgi:hypothetical protein